MKKKLLPLSLNIIVVISTLIGLFITFKSSNFMSTKALYYYTIQSNILILIISLVFIIYILLNKIIPYILYVIKYIITVGVSITFLIFLFLLTPQIIITGDINYLLSISNLTLHFITPIAAIIGFVLYDKCKFKNSYCILGISMPLYYLFFALIISKIYPIGIFKNFDGSLSKFPYFFLDYEKNGWFGFGNNFFNLGSFYWIIIISIITILISAIILKLSNHHNK